MFMLHRASTLRVLFLLILALALAAPSALATASVHINARTEVYQLPSTSSRHVTAPSGLKVTLTSASNGWGKVTYKRYTAYIPLKYLTLNNPIKAYTRKQVTLFEGPGSSALGHVAAGKTVYVVGMEDDYARVTNRSGSITGYIKASLLTRYADEIEFEPDGTTSMPDGLRSTTRNKNGSKVEYAIYIAQNLLGAPYSDTPDPPKTFDCSKFTVYCYGKTGSVTLQGSARAQGYDGRFARIDSIGSLKRGDLVCFDTVGDDDVSDHVGIYLGKGYFIHASSAKRKIVVSTLASGYYYQKFSWGVRIFS